MSNKLATTNQYLRDGAVRERLVFRSVATSSAIEGVHAPFKEGRISASKGAKKSPVKKAHR